jgi:hypothetical protein
MSIPRKVEIRGQPGLACPDGHDNFVTHNKQMRRFRQNHGVPAGTGIALMIGMHLYIMPSLKDYGGAAGFLSAVDLPRFVLMRRPNPSLFHRN